MKKLFFIALLILPFLSFGEDFKQLKHNPVTYVDDFANLFTPEEEQAMDYAIKQFKAKSTVEISIVSVNSLDGYDVSEFTLNLARQWGVGGTTNNGLMILISKDPRKLRTEVGYGLEGDLPDVTVIHFQEKYAVPFLKNNQYGQGILSLLNSYISHLDPVALEQKKAQDAKDKFEAEQAMDSFLNVLLWIGILSVLIFIAFRTYRHIRKKQAEKERLIKEAAAKAEQERLRKEQAWSNTVKTVQDYKVLVSKAEELGLNDEIIKRLKSFENHDLTAKDDISRRIVQTKIENLSSQHLSTLQSKISSIVEELKIFNSIPERINKIGDSVDYKLSQFERKISLYPEFKFNFKNDDILKKKGEHLKKANEVYLQSQSLRNEKNWDKFSTNIIDCLTLLSLCEDIDHQLTSVLSTIYSHEETVKNIPSNLKSFASTFQRYSALPYISAAFKSKEQEFKQNLNFDPDTIRNADGSRSLTTIIQKYLERTKVLDSILSIARTEEKRENDRLKAIQDEKDRIAKEAKRKKDQEEEEERRKRKRRQDEEDEQRRRNDSYSSSYSSSWGSSDSGSSSSGSDFGGGSFGGGGGSSDY